MARSLDGQEKSQCPLDTVGKMEDAQKQLQTQGRANLAILAVDRYMNELTVTGGMQAKAPSVLEEKVEQGSKVSRELGSRVRVVEEGRGAGVGP